MEINSKNMFVIAVMLLVGTAITSCNKPDIVTSVKEGSIYMPRAAGDNSKLALLLTDTVQPVIFGAAYGGLNYPASDVAVTFAVDSSVISSYNSLNGTSYVLLPASSYKVPSLSAVIKAGQTTSNGLPVNIITTSLDKSVKYILPITITAVSSGTIDSSLRTTYFAIDTIQKLEKDITGLATLEVSKDNDGGADAGEGSKKLVDGDYNSKFLSSGYASNFWVQLKFPSAQVLGAYTITSGNDAPERDAKDWKLSGSNDGTSWTDLDTKSSQTFPDRNQTIRFEFDNHTAYTYYRLSITANGGSDLIQISEWRVITYP